MSKATVEIIGTVGGYLLYAIAIIFMMAVLLWIICSLWNTFFPSKGRAVGR